MKAFIKEYRVELVVLALALLGIFLLVEQFELRVMLWQSIDWLGSSIRLWAMSTRQRVVGYITTFTLSDLTGWILLLATLAFIIWRARWRFLRSARFNRENCPRCASPLVRVHRTRLDRLWMQLFRLKAYRYRCRDPHCGWSGLLKPVHHRRRKSRPETI